MDDSNDAVQTAALPASQREHKRERLDLGNRTYARRATRSGALDTQTGTQTGTHREADLEALLSSRPPQYTPTYPPTGLSTGPTSSSSLRSWRTDSGHLMMSSERWRRAALRGHQEPGWHGEREGAGGGHGNEGSKVQQGAPAQGPHYWRWLSWLRRYRMSYVRTTHCVCSLRPVRRSGQLSCRTPRRRIS